MQGGEILTSTKWEQEWECNIFFSQTFKGHYIIIWSCILQDVMEILPMLMPQIFVDQFVFIFKVVNNVP